MKAILVHFLNNHNTPIATSKTPKATVNWFLPRKKAKVSSNNVPTNSSAGLIPITFKKPNHAKIIKRASLFRKAAFEIILFLTLEEFG